MARDTSAYQIGGKRVPSVTEVLRLAGLVSFGGADPAALEVGRRRGDEVDSWLTLLETGDITVDDEPPPEIAGYVTGWINLRRTTGFVQSAVQKAFVSARWGFAGTVDVVGQMNGRGALLDWKTGNGEPWYEIQTAGYVLGMESLKLIDEGKPLYRGVALLQPDGTARLVEHRNHELDKGRFKMALEIAKLRILWGFAQLGET